MDLRAIGEVNAARCGISEWRLNNSEACLLDLLQTLLLQLSSTPEPQEVEWFAFLTPSFCLSMLTSQLLLLGCFSIVLGVRIRS